MKRFLLGLFLSTSILTVNAQTKIGRLKPSTTTNDFSAIKEIHGTSFRKAGFIELDELQHAQLISVLENEDSVTLELFRGFSITAKKNTDIKKTTNGFYWRGTLTNGEEGYVDLYFRKGLLSGTVYAGNTIYKLDAITPFSIRVVELSPEEDTHFECETLEDHNHDEIQLSDPRIENTIPSTANKRTAANPIIVDVMVIYPQVVETSMGGPQGMENEVNFRIEEANQVFANSLINVELRLVHHQVETSVSADASGAGDVRTSAVETLRAKYKADLVSFWSNNGSAGSGFNFEGTGSTSTGFNTSKFSLVQTYYTFIHEIGHNLGAKHDRQTYYEKSPTSSKLNVTPYYRYGKSFVGYRSIMSYSSCNDLPGGSSSDCERVPYMTNPDIMVNGKPFGVQGENQTYSVNGPANNARRINETAPYVANYFIGQTVEKYELIVNQGNGSGNYEKGNSATISALDKSAQQLEFDKWTGDVQYIANVNANFTTVTMPDFQVTITATYKAIDYTNTTTLNVSLTASNDDVEESGDGSGNMYANSSDLELTLDGSKGNQTIGIRFPNVAIPKGMEIESASLLFTADATKSDVTSLQISTDDLANSEVFKTTPFDISTRTTISPSIPWNPTAWTNEQQYNSPDLSKIVQAIIDKNDWNSGNAITFVITGTGVRSAHSYDGDPSKSPILQLKFKAKTNTPIVVNEIQDKTVDKNFQDFTINLKDVFNDVETSDDKLVFIYAGSTNVNVSMVNGIATISAKKDYIGTETLVFKAIDEDGKFVEDEFTLTINDVVLTIFASQNNHSFKAYPNPTADYLTIESNKLEYELFDVFGNLLLTGNKKRIDLSNYSKGVYILRQGTQSIKIIKK